MGRNGVFEMTGSLCMTWAVGQIPGGAFRLSEIVIKGHNLYVFEGGVPGQRPTAQPRVFFNIRRAEVEVIGLLVNPPLPPQTNVFKITFSTKQFGHRAYFFKVRTTPRPRRAPDHAAAILVEPRVRPSPGRWLCVHMMCQI